MLTGLARPPINSSYSLCISATLPNLTIIQLSQFHFIMYTALNQGSSSKIYNQMEENIPYRKLKILKPCAIKSTSEQLLRPIFRHRFQETNQQASSDIMTQNVTQYHYMLADPHLKENYINWATNLRGYSQLPAKEQPVSDPPCVFYKQTVVEKLRKQIKTKTKSSHINTADYSQYFGKDCVKVPQSAMNFMSDLRKIEAEHKENGKLPVHDQIFNSYVGKQRNSLPRLLKKSSIKKLRDISPSDYEQEMDGTHKYPEYTYKNLREKNSALISALSKSHDSISLPGLAWSVGLRSY